MGNGNSGEMNLNVEDLEKKEVIGKGALCQVIRCEWLPARTEVALKTFFCPEITETEMVDFQRELELTRTLCRNHTNFVHYYAGCSKPPNLYLVMEYLPSGDLSRYLRNKYVNLPWSFRFQCALDTARGMEYLHANCVMHRDLKPENLLVVQLPPTEVVPCVKIGDLGISKMSDAKNTV